MTFRHNICKPRVLCVCQTNTQTNLTSTLGVLRTHVVIENKCTPTGGREQESRLPSSPYKNKSAVGSLCTVSQEGGRQGLKATCRSK